MFLRNESFGEYIRSYPMISILLSINVFFYIWTGLFTFLGGQEIYLLGIGFNPAIWAGEWWRLVTPIFLHASLLHVGFNSFALFLFGPALERLLGGPKFLFIYLGTGILANIVYLFIGSPVTAHLGASGAVFGLFGLYVYMVLLRKDLISHMNAQTILVITGIGVVMTFVNPNINIIAHIFGLISGALLGPIVLSRVTSADYFRQREVHDPDEIGFDPDRWKKKEAFKKKKWLYIGGGAAAMILFFYLVDTFFFS
ncbi:rhomboid family intramembrane serine protease [Alkalicoccus luteus]|uniref:rhomboid family intramembrane serine protease n=1 Tax=Alkalicoccus luteus TaxID=1237094 RepID=UPI004034F646